MAFSCRVLSSVARRYRRLNLVALRSNFHRLFFHKESNSNPLLIKLLQLPSSRVKSTLDNEMRSFKKSDFSWEFLVTSLKTSSSEKARLVLEWILDKMLKDNERDPSIFSEVISLCGKLQNVPLAMHVLSSMEANGVKPTSLVFNSLINTCLSSHNIVTAFSLFEIMENSESYKPDCHTYNIFISAFSKSGNFDAMMAWYLAKKAAGFGPDLQTYESLIFGCVKLRNFEVSDRIFEEMINSGIVPSLSILENMLEGFCQQKSLGQAEEFFKSLQDAGWEISENMAEKLVALYIELGLGEKMEELLETMTMSYPDAGVLSRIHCGIIRMYAMLDRLNDVEFAVGRMLKQGLSFSCADDVEAVICSYFRRAAHDRLDIFLECIESRYTLPGSTYSLLIAGYRRAGLDDKVELVKKNMKVAGFA